MSKKLLIDAHQSDETRVVVLNNNTIEDVDYEVSHRRPLKGNIYLAKVTRVEPSLQAAFVEYGGNRQGFLAFSEIHPDYYRIPIEDREKLLAEQAADDDNNDDDETDSSDENPDDSDPDDEKIKRRYFERFRRHYSIQEVISRHQILLIQVAKEERGSKGAALTTYLSLAGRYCVLMPNTWHKGGVSRKISDQADRKKLKTIISKLEVPTTMAVIVRTAGLQRTKAEITRDFNYLVSEWNEIREKTLTSSAPFLVYEEGDLIKRSIRDHYSADIEEIMVEGNKAFKLAQSYMKSLMPTHVKKIKEYKEPGRHLFQEFKVESMLSALHEPQVTLKSGGYLIIDQTEALVAVDVNSGRSTRERNIEETALKTNLEAAAEVARQLKQRDLSGLIVIDFIDMVASRNKNAVKRKLKDELKNDKARIQVGDISQFGLLEMSRQRLRPSISESMTDRCPHCDGSGRIKSNSNLAIEVIRLIEEELVKRPRATLNITVSEEIAFYLLNHKRAVIVALEEQYNTTIILERDNSLIPPAVKFSDAKTKSDSGKSDKSDPSSNDETQDENQDDENKTRRRRRGKRGGRRRNTQREDGDEASSVDALDNDAETGKDQVQSETDQSEDEAEKPKRTRRKSTKAQDEQSDSTEESTEKPKRTRRKSVKTEDEQSGRAEESVEKPKRTRRKPVKAEDEQSDGAEEPVEKPKRTRRKSVKAEDEQSDGAEEPVEKPKRTRRKPAKSEEVKENESSTEDDKPKPRGRTRKTASESEDASADAGRESKSSAIIDVVDVDKSKNSRSKKGWWSP